MIEAEDHKKLRQYLLGEITEPTSLVQIEERLLTDDDYYEKLEITSEELIEQYLNKELTGEELKSFESHYLSTPERLERVRFTQTLRLYNATRGSQELEGERRIVSKAGWRQWFFTPAFKVAVCVIALAAVSFVVWQLFYSHSDVDKGLEALRAAYHAQRPVEARISGFNYAPLLITRSGQQETANSANTDRAERILLDAVHDAPGTDSHHALGQLYLARREFDKATAQFNEALKTAPDNAQLQSDMGAALLEKAKAARAAPDGAQYLETLALSLEHLNKALALNGTLPVALFNKALCLQYMMAPGQAREAWQKYLETDSQSPWAEEARRNLRQLEERSSGAQDALQVLENFMRAYHRQDDEQAWQTVSRNREMITGKMVAFHLIRKLSEASSAQARSEEVGDILNALAYAGKLEKERGGDPFFEQLASYYTSAWSDKSALLAEAQTAVTVAYNFCQKAEYEQALKHFLRARDLFTKADNALEANLTDYWIAYSYSQTDRIREGALLLNSLVEYSQKGNFKWLLSQALCWLANCYDLLGEHSQSISYDQQALTLAETIADTYNQQKLLTQIALQYTQLGQPRRALAYNRRSLALSLDGPSSPRQAWRNFTFISQTFYALKKYDAAAVYEHQALQLGSDELRDPTLIHLSHINLGMIYGARQQYDEARAHLEASLQTARASTDELARQRMVAYSTLQLAHLKRQLKDYGGALENYNSALDIYGRMEFELDTYDAHKGRLLCYLAVGDDSTITAEMSQVMELFERYRARILEEQNRNSFFDAEQSVYDLAIDYAFSTNRSRQAFEYSEASRARSLLDSLQHRATLTQTSGQEGWESASVTKPLDLSAIQAQLPPRAQILQYSVLKDRLLIWVISSTQFDVIEKKVSADELNALTLKYVQMLGSADRARPEEVARDARTLYEILISPVEHLLNSSREICIIPDKALFYLPFATLISPATGQYLLSNYTLLFSPSASVLTLSSALARKRDAATEETFVGVGDPAFDRAAYPHLPDLPTARVEALKAAQNYQVSACFTGVDALKAPIESEMEKANVIHFACHYVTDETSPMNSKLLLAKGSALTASESDWALSAFEVSQKRLRQVRLVVLSACQTGLESYYNGEGMIGISRTFLVAGAPLVVASQWPVETEATAQLMINFHKLRKTQGLSTTAALRRAQLDMIKDPDGRYSRPYYWAGFLAIGAYAAY